jgi:hypothetical protein
MVTRNEGAYLPDEVLLALRQAGKTLREIALANFKATGFEPDRAQLSRKLTALGAESGVTTHRSLLPWEIRPEHNSSRWRRMLQAKSKQLAELPLSETEERAVRLLDFLLDPERGRHFVVTYHAEVGFCLVDAGEGEEIIRPPVIPNQNGSTARLGLV